MKQSSIYEETQLFFYFYLGRHRIVSRLQLRIAQNLIPNKGKYFIIGLFFSVAGLNHVICGGTFQSEALIPCEMRRESKKK